MNFKMDSETLTLADLTFDPSAVEYEQNDEQLTNIMENMPNLSSDLDDL